MHKKITFIGFITNVDSGKIDVRISNDIPSASPIIDGIQYRIGQIGTLVRIPLGNTMLFGVVDSINISGVDQTKITLIDHDLVNRNIRVNLIGEKIGRGVFQKGIGVFPTINDEVHIVTESDIKSIYDFDSTGQIELGTHASSNDLPIYLDLQKIISRHLAILGSTGSGKSNTTARVISSILEKFEGSRIILIDIHGEYSSAFPAISKVMRLNSPDSPLYIPYWAMNFDELSFFLVGREAGSERPEDKRLREEIVRLKKENKDKIKAGSINEEYITEDSPIPFDIRLMWHNLNREVIATYNKADQASQTRDNEMLIDEGDYSKLIPAQFQPYTVDSKAPYKSKNQTMYLYEKKIFSRLSDNKYDFMFKPGGYLDGEIKDLNDLIIEWMGHEKRLTILDLSGIPYELMDISIGLINRIVYDSMFWGKDEDYTGRARPILMVFEEAHAYLPKNQDSRYIYGYARKSVEKIFKEGRKFGIGAAVVTQRPSEISDTILAQVGTTISMRLTNSSDQSSVKATAPNNMTGLMDLLPTLRIGECIVVGDAIKIPSRVRIQKFEPRPNSNDPDIIKSWSHKFESKDTDYINVVRKMRERRF